MATSVAGEGQPILNGITSDPQTKKLTDLPTELLEHILCFPVLKHVDICNVSCCCKRLHDVCHGRGKVWGHQYKLRCYDFYVLFLRSFGFCRLSPLSGKTSHPFISFHPPRLEPQIAHCLLKGGLVNCESQPLTLC